MNSSNLEFKVVPSEPIKPGVYRSLIYTQHIMMAVIDFTNGPWQEPDPFHSHPHEQVTYVAIGEILFYCDGRPEEHLKEGDVFAVPSGIKHTIKILTKEVRLVDSFTPIREEFLI